MRRKAFAPRHVDRVADVSARRRAVASAALAFPLGVGLAVLAAALALAKTVLLDDPPGVRNGSDVVFVRHAANGTLLTSKEADGVLDAFRARGWSAGAQENRQMLVSAGGVERAMGVAFVDNFDVTATSALDGRLFAQGQRDEGVAVVSARLWRELRGKGETAEVHVDGRIYAVVGSVPDGYPGLMARQFSVGATTLPEVWLPSDGRRAEVREEGRWMLLGIRLPPGQELSDARELLKGVSVSDHVSERDALVAYRSRPDWGEDAVAVVAVLGVYLAIPLIVLAIGWANSVNAQLARTVARVPELRVRRMLGASDFDLVCQLAGETVASSLAAFGLAAVGAVAVCQYLRQVTGVPLEVDVGVLVATGVVTVVLMSALVAVPGISVIRSGSIASQQRAVAGMSFGRLRTAIVVGQLSASVALVALGMVATARIQAYSDPLRGATGDIWVYVGGAEHPLSPRDAARVHANLEQVSEIDASGVADFVLDEATVEYAVQGAADVPLRTALGGCVSGRWFDAFGVRVVAGQLPSADVRGVDAQIVVTTGIARRLADAPDGAVGRRLVVKDARGQRHEGMVVGVVDELLDDVQGVRPMVFLYSGRVEWARSVIVAKGRGGVDGVIAAFRKALADVDPQMANVAGIESIRMRLAKRLAGPREIASVVLRIALVGALLAATGVAALLSYIVVLRNRETAIRMALGASKGTVIASVMSRTAGWLAIAVPSGVAMAVGVARGLGGVFVGAGVLDGWALLAASAGVAGIAALASLWPAVAATFAEPATLLRSE